MVGGSTISGVRLSKRCSTSRQTTSSTAKVTKKAAAVQTCFTVASFHAEVDHQDVHIVRLFQLESGGRPRTARIRAPRTARDFSCLQSCFESW
jgi:hypothetical protein